MPRCTISMTFLLIISAIGSPRSPPYGFQRAIVSRDEARDLLWAERNVLQKAVDRHDEAPAIM